MLKRTPLFAAHQERSAKLVEFGGWEMPVFYTSIVDEHLVVRRSAGLFDISHMGEIWVEGEGAADFINSILTNDVAKLEEGRGHYTLLCNENGGVIDDLYLYRLAKGQFLLVINASRITEDWAWIESQWKKWGRTEDCEVVNVSDDYGAVALQGPNSGLVMDTFFSSVGEATSGASKPSEMTKNQVARFCYGSESAIVARTGYTGEDGFEILVPSNEILKIWEGLLSAGHPHCLQPAGLGARDTLRTEMCYPLYGHELGERRTALAAGVGFAIALDKDNFVGLDAMKAQREAGLDEKLIAFKMLGRSAPPRDGYPIWTTGKTPESVGVVSSGTQSPSLGCGIGLGYLPMAHAKIGSTIEIEIRNRKFPAEIVKKPIYRKAD